MFEPTEDPLLGKADAAFRLVATKVLKLARQTGTPVVIRINGELRSVSPDDLQDLENKPSEGHPIQAPN